jgi:cytidylate kinase
MPAVTDPHVLPPQPPEVPLHGWQGDRATPAAPGFQPAALSIAVSRETGARGITIAKSVSKRLGWQYYDQEMLEYVAQEERHRRDLFDSLEPEALEWITQEQQRLVAEHRLRADEPLLELARVVLALGSKGQAVILGRGAGCILPREAVLRVRLIAPLAERIAYMAQFQRLTPEKAAEFVCTSDRQRAEFMVAHFFRRPDDVYEYDMVLNPSQLGVEAVTQAIAQAALVKNAAWQEHLQQGMMDSSVPVS